MNEIPGWWLVVSLIFFGINALAFVAIGYVLFQLVKVVRALQPKVEGLVTKVEGVTAKVDGLTTTLQTTVRNVGEKASGVAGSASAMASTTSKVFERYAPLLGIVLTGLKILGSINEYRSAHRKTAALPEKEA